MPRRPLCVRSVLSVERRAGGWELTVLAGRPGDYETPFREMLAEIAGILGQVADVEIRLPAFEAWEDFVEGSLQFRDATLAVYFEHSLSYLVLTSDDETVTRRVMNLIEPHTVLVA